MCVEANRSAQAIFGSNITAGLVWSCADWTVVTASVSKYEESLILWTGNGSLPRRHRQCRAQLSDISGAGPAGRLSRPATYIHNRPADGVEGRPSSRGARLPGIPGKTRSPRYLSGVLYATTIQSSTSHGMAQLTTRRRYVCSLGCYRWLAKHPSVDRQESQIYGESVKLYQSSRLPDDFTLIFFFGGGANDYF